MKKIISKTMAMMAVSASILSFSPKTGGEGFEISLNDKIVIQQYGSDMNNVKSLQLNQTRSNDQLTIKYHHCGKVGKNRVVIIKDGQNNTLKKFNYADVATPVAAMTIPVQDILNLKKSAGSTFLKLFYSSSELPSGRILASIILEQRATVHP